MTTKTVTDVKSVNLLEIGKQLALTAEGLKKKVDDAGRPLSIPASMLAGKLPVVKPLGDLKIFQMIKVKTEYKINTLTVFKKEDGTCGIYTADLEEITDFEVISYKTGLYGFTVLKHTSGLELIASISWNDDHLIELEELGQDGIEGKGLPPVSALRDLPKPETPLWSPFLPENKELQILSNGKFSKEYQTPLVNVKLPNGDIQKDVLCNKDLERLYEKYGDGMRFKIANKRQVKRKNEGDKKVWLVDIIDCQLDLSDL